MLNKCITVKIECRFIQNISLTDQDQAKAGAELKINTDLQLPVEL